MSHSSFPIPRLSFLRHRFRYLQRGKDGNETQMKMQRQMRKKDGRTNKKKISKQENPVSLVWPVLRHLSHSISIKLVDRVIEMVCASCRLCAISFVQTCWCGTSIR